ncbi:MAG: hypothetical protein CVV05_16455 [Gammaproteobacteria bacterium HGW-Gammaproteobacteria-1]|jgi:hypothetical protein|nr:MAG: hypothetical protein CVV05_16455 [Gammaproteobacteria bacterium HGW-Gammaproteobacteria-1]
MEEWHPISQSSLERLIQAELTGFSEEQKEIFERFRVAPYKAPIQRCRKSEEVFVVAKNGTEVMYYEDVEESFNFSPVSEQGEILQSGWNQDELKYALWHWIQKSR